MLFTLLSASLASTPAPATPAPATPAPAAPALATPAPATPPGLPSPRARCGTPALVPTFGPAPRLLPSPPPPHPQADGRETRDAYGEYPNELEGAHFVVKWGDTGNVDWDAAEALLDAFEDAWASEIDERGFPAPAGTDRYLFNIYIGDTGDGAPDGFGTSGYFNRDLDGFPMIVVSAATLSDLEWARGTAAHEFFHAVQDVTGRYAYSGDSAWYWEATAMWIEGEVLDGYEDYVAFLYGYALLPHLPVHFFDYPDTGALQEYHQYGAMIFPRYLSEIAADGDLVRDSWVEDLGAETPQDAIAQLLAERGIAFEDAFGDFAARNAVWDYADGELYAEWVDYYGDYFRAEDHRLVDDLDADGTDGLVAAPASTLPGRFGYNVVRLQRPYDGDYIVRFEGAEKGSGRSTADWRVTVVQDAPGGPLYTTVPLNGGVGEVTLSGVDGPLQLVAAAVPGDARQDETFAWSYSFTHEDADVAEPGEDPLPERPSDVRSVEVAGGCDTTGGGAGRGWLAGALVVAGMIVRRRR